MRSVNAWVEHADEIGGGNLNSEHLWQSCDWGEVIMARFIPRRAKFGDVYLHVTNISNVLNTETVTQTDQKSKTEIVTRFELENFTIDGFLQGPRAATDLEKLKKMLDGKEQKSLITGFT